MRRSIVKAIAVLMACVFSCCLAGSSFGSYASTVSATGAPSWYFTVPKASTIEPRSFSVGLPYIEYSPTDRLEVGLHGLKYRLEGVTENPFALGVDPIMGFAYAYAIWDLPAGDNNLSLGVKVFPLFLLLGFETQLDERVSFIAEVNDGAMAGLRVRIDPNWHVEFGAGIAAYGTWRTDPFDHRGIHDYDFDDLDFEPTIWAGFAYSDFLNRYSQ
jgi:hypothetical protein